MIRRWLKLLQSKPQAPELKMPCRTQGQVHFWARNGGRIEVHPTVLLNSRQEGYHVGMPFETTLLADSPQAVIRIGAECRIHGTYIHAWDHVYIGRNVLIAAGTTIVDANGHSADVRFARHRQNFRDQPKGIVIGDYVWIGMNAMILKGVEVGECAIIAAGSVVKESVPAFSVVEGNPAKVVRFLDPAGALPASVPLEELAAEPGFYRY